MLAHRPPGIVGIYDIHEYLDEKREALEAWAQRIASIVNPVPRQGHQAAEAAAMINVEFFTYTEPEWAAIREQVLADLSVDVDRIERQITHLIQNRDFEESFTGMEPLRERIEVTVGLYHFHSAVSRHRPRRDELIERRKDVENLRASIINVLTVPVRTELNVHKVLLNGVDADMLIATGDYFRKLLRNIDSQIAQTGSRRDNARKPDRDRCWTELRAIWIDIGGKPHGEAAAEFIKLASLPAMNSAVPARKSIVQWLERRRLR